MDKLNLLQRRQNGVIITYICWFFSMYILDSFPTSKFIIKPFSTIGILLESISFILLLFTHKDSKIQCQTHDFSYLKNVFLEKNHIGYEFKYILIVYQCCCTLLLVRKKGRKETICFTHSILSQASLPKGCISLGTQISPIVM